MKEAKTLKPMKCNQCQEEVKLIFEPDLICSQCLHEKIKSSKEIKLLFTEK